jgi:hypothetical protein
VIQDVKETESGMNIFDHIYESLLTFFGLKYNALSFSVADPGGGQDHEAEELREQQVRTRGGMPLKS